MAPLHVKLEVDLFPENFLTYGAFVVVGGQVNLRVFLYVVVPLAGIPTLPALVLPGTNLVHKRLDLVGPLLFSKIILSSNRGVISSICGSLLYLM